MRLRGGRGPWELEIVSGRGEARVRGKIIYMFLGVGTNREDDNDNRNQQKEEQKNKEQSHQSLKRAERVAKEVLSSDVQLSYSQISSCCLCFLPASHEGANTRATHPSAAARRENQNRQVRNVVMLDENHCCSSSFALHISCR